jgi:TetR/AcrR family fatty acid metabolism transcriptional regulator
LQAEKILAAAAQLFTTHRFHEARMEDIAALAEVGKGTLYRYFHDKEELYVALLNRAGEGLAGRFKTEIRASDTPRRQLIGYVRAIIENSDANPHLLELIQHAEVMQTPGKGFPWQQTREHTVALGLDILKKGKTQGDFVIADPPFAIWMLLGGVRALLRFSPTPRPADLPERVVASFLAGHCSSSGLRLHSSQRGRKALV